MIAIFEFSFISLIFFGLLIEKTKYSFTERDLIVLFIPRFYLEEHSMAGKVPTSVNFHWIQ